MKKLLLALSLSACFQLVNAQNLPVNQGTGKVTYLEVNDATGMTNEQLKKVVADWAAAHKFTAKEEAADKVVYDAFTPVDYNGVSGKLENGKVLFTVSVFFKDGKYRYIFTDFVHEGDIKTKANGGKLENLNPDCGTSKMTAATWVNIKKKTDTNLRALTDDLKRVIKEFQNDPANKTDW